MLFISRIMMFVNMWPKISDSSSHSDITASSSVVKVSEELSVNVVQDWDIILLPWVSACSGVGNSDS